MATRNRKTRKMRGTRTVSYGQIGQHRKSGSQGGHGMAGLHKHKWSWTVKYDPDYYGNHGFTSLQRKIKTWINLDQLDDLYKRIEPKEKKDEMALLDLTKLGYQKLLGRGGVTAPYYIVVDRITEEAKKGIVDAGGKVEGS
ncbi:MAG: 50S ribosomal protein L15 [Nitrososphaerota archaeon]|nr:50S ribosomal protein L15 [Nitrososphaerota archaeon]MDG7038511.1 50S ribosomal protein L15 [Nitrososphaerota archaeon]